MAGADDDTEDESELPSEWVEDESDDEETGRRRGLVTMRASEMVSTLMTLERLDCG